MKNFLEKSKGFIPLALITIAILIVGYFIAGDTSIYADLEKPPFSPTPYVFGIAWSILYTLMFISLYLIYKTNCYECEKKRAYSIFFIQLIINIIWPAIFFGEDKFFIAFLWILILVIAVIFMIFEFKKINKLSAYLQIPYLFWLLFASYLNYSIYMLN